MVTVIVVMGVVVGAVSVGIMVVVVVVVAVVAVVVGIVVVIVRPSNLGSEVVADIAASVMVLPVAPAAGFRVIVRRVATAIPMHGHIHRRPVWA